MSNEDLPLLFDEPWNFNANFTSKLVFLSGLCIPSWPTKWHRKWKLTRTILNKGKFKSTSLTFTLCSIPRISVEAGTLVRACMERVSWNKILDCLACPKKFNGLTTQTDWKGKKMETITNVENKVLFVPMRTLTYDLQLSKPMAFSLPVGLALKPMLWSRREEEILCHETDWDIHTVLVCKAEEHKSR